MSVHYDEPRPPLPATADDPKRLLVEYPAAATNGFNNRGRSETTLRIPLLPRPRVPTAPTPQTSTGVFGLKRYLIYYSPELGTYIILNADPLSFTYVYNII